MVYLFYKLGYGLIVDWNWVCFVYCDEKQLDCVDMQDLDLLEMYMVFVRFDVEKNLGK